MNVTKLHEIFAESARKYPNNIALAVSGKKFSYRQLNIQAKIICSQISSSLSDENPIGILSSKTFLTYAGVLGILSSGRAYVPLSVKLPISKLSSIIEIVNCSAIFVDENATDVLPNILRKLSSKPLTIFYSKECDSAINELRHKFALVRFLLVAGNEVKDVQNTKIFSDNAVAYICFTSGSTGNAKAVAIKHRNVIAYLNNIKSVVPICSKDRVSQQFDLSFDLSVHDLFFCWQSGAALYCVSDATTIAPAKFIRSNQLTVWFSSPAVIRMMERLKLLKPGVFPSLRYSLFCGDVLTVNSAQMWLKASPNSSIHNLYGPTECTIAITSYKCTRDNAEHWSHLSGVPIGPPFASQSVKVLNKEGEEVSNGESGELYVSGSQVSDGYLNSSSESNRKNFTPLEGHSVIWYRTGDLVKQDTDGCLHFLGRVDNQIKVLGYRVELEELEGIVREAAGVEDVAVAGLPNLHGSFDEVIAVVCGSTKDDAAIRYGCRQHLPSVLIPREFVRAKGIPVTINGKIDRAEILKMREKLLG